MEATELRARRRDLNYTQAQLAAALGLSANTIARWERGETPIGNAALVRLALQSVAGSTDRRASPSSAPRHNLPRETTSFVGRDDDVRALRELLLNKPLVTLTGPGGVGKTRLALHVAAALVDRFRDGVWLVQLADVASEDLVGPAIGAALRIAEQPVRNGIHPLADALSGRHLLLVLDNCEHVLEAAANIVEALVQGCPEAVVLATSREPLEVHGEQVWRVAPLAVSPDAGAEAVRLFLERASPRASDLLVRDHDLAAVVEICRRVDGLPLAVELAAAGLELLGPRGIAQRLAQQQRLPSNPGTRSPPRHRSLSAAFDWSYALLGPDEQSLFERLAVFAGGCGADGARAIAAPEKPADEVVDTLGQLLRKSLITVEQQPDTPRYHMLQPVQHYAREKLEARGELDDARRRHAGYFTDFAASAAVKAEGPQASLSAAALDRERDNIRVALRWLIDQQQTARALALGARLLDYWYSRGLLSEGAAWLSEMLQLPDADSNPILRAYGENALAVLLHHRGQHGEAVRLHESALATLEPHSDHLGVAIGLCGLGHIAWVRGQLAEAERLFVRAQVSSQMAASQQWQIICCNNLGGVAFDRHELATSQAAFERGLAMASEAGSTWAMAIALSGLGSVALERHDIRLARRLHEEALELRQQIKDPRGTAQSWAHLGQLALAHGDVRAAHQQFELSLRMAREIGDRQVMLRSLEGIAACLARRDLLGQARLLADAAQRLRQSLDIPASVLESRQLARSLAGARGQATARRPDPPAGMTLDGLVAYALGLDANQLAPHRRVLSERQEVVARLIASGLTNRQIAETLVISEGTVQRHVANLLTRLGFSSRAQIAAWISQRQ